MNVIGLLLSAALAIACVLLWRRLLQAKQHHSQLGADLLSEREARASEVATLRERIDRLATWESVADADDAARRMLEQARQDAAALLAAAEVSRSEADAAAESIRGEAAAEAEQIRSEAKQHGLTAGAAAESLIGAANARAEAIVAAAQARAEEIAGDALKALQEAQGLESTVRALKNVIEGYGDQYIVPGATLIDDLAEGFDHTEAGQQLKLVRDAIRAAVKRGAAATCDYVEPNRRKTAIRFDVDAFNGKVDSTLARTKHDNLGTLQQAIRDAFALVNHNGQAFRSARILPEYLALRLEELRWTTVVRELQLQEREEQRRIKEQIREEEKARREYERAMKEAAKEEDMLRRAMEKATQQLSKASEEQRAKYEQQLAELAQKLTEAEERNQRAMSMAQQTKRGHVYVISNIGSFGEQVYKIGLTRRLDPLERIRELGDSSVPFAFDVHALIFSDDAPALESRLHKHFVLGQVNKVNHRKEFFRVDVAHIRSEIEKMGLKAHWTLTAEAREYRESLAIDTAIQDNPALRDAWIKRQLLLEDLPEDSADEESEGSAVAASMATTLADLVPNAGVLPPMPAP